MAKTEDPIEECLRKQAPAVKRTGREVLWFLRGVVRDGVASLLEDPIETDIYPVQMEFKIGSHRFLFQVDTAGALEVWRGNSYLGDSLDAFTLGMFFENGI